MKRKMGLKEGILTGGIISAFLVMGILIYTKISTNDSLFAEGNGKKPTIIYENETTNFTGRKFLSSNYTITTSNDTLIEVSDGSLTATQVGTYTIYATDEDGKVHKEDVIVCKKLTKDSLQAGQITLTEGETLAINLDLGENEACYNGITYNVINKDIANISGKNKLLGVQAGQTQMSITQNEERISVPVYIFEREKNIEAEKITLAPDQATIKINQTIVINGIISPSDTTNKSIMWTSSNPTIATVNSKGEVIGHKEGKTTITAQTSNGKKASATITVTKSQSYTISYIPGTSLEVAGTMNPTMHTVGTIAKTSNNAYKLSGWTFVGYAAKKGNQLFGNESQNSQAKGYVSQNGRWNDTNKTALIAVYEGKNSLGFSSYLKSDEKVTMQALWARIASAQITGVKGNEVKATVRFTLPARTTWSIRAYNGSLFEVARYYTGTSTKTYTLDKYIAKGKYNYMKINACLVQNGKVTSICVTNATLYTGYNISYSPGTSLEVNGTMASTTHSVGTVAKTSTNKYSLPGWTFVGWAATKGVETFGNDQARSKEVGYTSNIGKWINTNSATSIAVYGNNTQLGFSKSLKNQTVTMKALWGRVINGKVINKENKKVNFSVTFNLPSKTTWNVRVYNGSKTEPLNRIYIDKTSYVYTGTVNNVTGGKIYVNACLVQNEQMTNICISSTTIAVSSFKQYNLTEAQLKGIARLCYKEQTTPEGAAAEASLIANRYELYPNSRYSNIYEYAKNGWWADAEIHMNNSQNDNAAVLKAVRDVLINGNRTLPLYIDEHDYIYDISSAITNGASHSIFDRTKYIVGTTILRNTAGAKYTFYGFYGLDKDPFGYTQEAYNKVMNK